jgi:HD-like signal output (HDOD) protein
VGGPRAPAAAHQFISKPCEPDVLKKIIEQTCAVLGKVTEPRMRGFLGGLAALPAMPQVCIDLDVAIQAGASANVIAEIVENDPALSAKLLQIINSAFYGMPVRLTSARQAVIVVGTSGLRVIAMSVKLASALDLRAAPSANWFDDRLRHAARVAQSARLFCDDPKLGELAFTAAVLHDVGELILVSQYGAEWAETLARAHSLGQPVHEAERETFGVSHADIGAFVLGLWGLPDELVDVVAHHHEPSQLARNGFGAIDAVYLADHLEASGAAATEEVRAYLEALGAGDRMPTWNRLLAAQSR